MQLPLSLGAAGAPSGLNMVYGPSGRICTGMPMAGCMGACIWVACIGEGIAGCRKPADADECIWARGCAMTVGWWALHCCRCACS